MMSYSKMMPYLNMMILLWLSILFITSHPVSAQTDTPVLVKAPAAPIKAALLYDLGGKFDRSFNESAWVGAQRFLKETGNPYKDFEPTSEIQYEQALRRYARRQYDAIIVVGFGYTVALGRVAREFPKTKFTAIDAVVGLENVLSITFKEDEGSFLAGVAAALHTKTDRVGFLGGMDIPFIRKFEKGYRLGIAFVNPDINILSNYVGSTPSAWNDPIKASSLARGQYTRGVDVIYHAAGPSGLGLIQAAKQTDNFAIGVDSNQNMIAPGHVLTSMLKRVDTGVYQALMATYRGEWRPGTLVLGLAEGGVDLAMDENNRDLITPVMVEELARVKKALIAGEIDLMNTLDIIADTDLISDDAEIISDRGDDDGR